VQVRNVDVVCARASGRTFTGIRSADRMGDLVTAPVHQRKIRIPGEPGRTAPRFPEIGGGVGRGSRPDPHQRSAYAAGPLRRATLVSRTMIQRNAGQAKGSAPAFLPAHGEKATPFPCNRPRDRLPPRSARAITDATA
jgi:hypothetical protein